MTDWPAEPARTSSPCATCRAPLAADQRYCLSCGERRADARVPFAEVLAAAPVAGSGPAGAARGTGAAGAAGAAGAPRGTGAASAAGAAGGAAAAAAAPRWQRIATPRPLALTVAAIFVCGLALGAAIGPPAPDSLAAGQGPIVVAQSPEAAAPDPDGGAGADAGGGSSGAVVGTGGGAADDIGTLGGAGDVLGGAASTDIFAGGGGSLPVDTLPPDTSTGTDPGSGGVEDPSAEPGLPAVGHVFTITLAGSGSGATFAHRAARTAAGGRAALDSAAPYLARTLTERGKLLSRFHAVAHGSLPSLIAMISGQPPTPETLANCPSYDDLLPGRLTAAGLAVGTGCVYPSSVQTVADQLATIAYRWRAYVQDIDRGPPGTPKACRRPESGKPDPTQVERPGDGFAASRVPFLYFDSIVDAPDCAKTIVPLERLERDLASAKDTPEYVSITPNLCEGGWAVPCRDGRRGGLAQADAFLKAWVPKILAAPAFKQDGLLVITFDQAPTAGDDADSRGCCGSKPGPNVKNLGGPQAPGAGGGIVGALVISPFVTGGTEDSTDYNHYSLLATVEDLFGLGRLANARAKGVEAFGANIFDRR